MEFCNSKNMVINYDFLCPDKCNGCIIYDDKAILEAQPDILSLREALLQSAIKILKGDTEDLVILNLNGSTKK